MIDKFFEMLGNLYLKLVFKRFIDNKDVENEFIKYGFGKPTKVTQYFYKSSLDYPYKKYVYGKAPKGEFRSYNFEVETIDGTRKIFEIKKYKDYETKKTISESCFKQLLTV